MSDYDARLRAALARSHRDVFDYDTRRMRKEYAVSEPCPACGPTTARPRFTKDWFTFDRCQCCGMVWTNPRLNDAALEAFYNGPYTAVYNERKFFIPDPAELALVEADARRFLTAAAPYIASGRFLEIGPGGEGTVMATALASGFDVTGVELTSACVDALRGRFGDTVRIVNCQLADAGFQDGEFDIVVMRDVLEHIAQPRRFLEDVSRVTIPGGVVIVQVPNIDGWIYRLVGARHTVVFGFEHVNYWNERSLRTVFDRAGFDVVDLAHRTTDFTLAHLQSYWFGPATFTTVISSPRASLSRRGLAWLTFRLCHLVRRLDSRLSPKLADATRHGSEIMVVARRRLSSDGVD